MANIEAQLKDHLKSGADWEKMETPIEGVNVVKVPATKTRPALLFLEINPLKDNGQPLKVYLRKTLELDYNISGAPQLRQNAKVSYKGQGWIMR